jgi:nitrogen regulatory protein PII
MKQLTIIVRPEKLSSITAALHHIGVTGMTISDVRGQGTPKGVTTIYRPSTAESSIRPISCSRAGSKRS